MVISECPYCGTVAPMLVCKLYFPAPLCSCCFDAWYDDGPDGTVEDLKLKSLALRERYRGTPNEFPEGMGGE